MVMMIDCIKASSTDVCLNFHEITHNYKKVMCLFLLVYTVVYYIKIVTANADA